MRRVMILCLLVTAVFVPSPASTRAPAALSPLSPSWEIVVPDTPAPLIGSSASLVVVATPAGRVAAHDVRDGSLRWEIRLDVALASAPLLIHDRVAVVSSQQIHFLDQASGLAVAVAALPQGACHAAPAGDDISVACADGSLRLIIPAHGASLWEKHLGRNLTAPPALCGSLLLAGAADGVLSAVLASDGSPRWVKQLDGAITAAPACHGDQAFVGGAGDRLQALRLGNRRARTRWSYRTGGDITVAPSFLAGRILLSPLDTWLYALDADNGHLAWRTRIGKRPAGPGVLLGDLFVVAPLNGEGLELFRLIDGSHAGSWRFDTGAQRLVTPVIAAGDGIAAGVAPYGGDTARIIRFESQTLTRTSGSPDRR